MEKAIYVLAAAIVIAAFFIGGLYTTVPAGQGSAVFVISRLSGMTFVCTGTSCREIPLE
jgi:hypothetical protein